MHRLLAVAAIVVASTLGVGQNVPTPDSQTLRAILEEIRLLRQELQTTTAAAQRVQIALYRLQLQDAAVARATKVVEEAHLKLNDLAAERKRLTANVELSEDQRGRAQDANERRRIEDEALPQLKKHLERIAHDEERWQAKGTEAEERLKAEQVKLDALHNLLDELDTALQNVGHRTATSSPPQH